MKKITIILISLLLVILVVKLKDNFSINIDPKNDTTQNSGLETKENTEGPVSVSVTPRIWDFEITLNTHSEELIEDLVVVSELVDDQGKTYQPISWEGTPPGGHHREGVLKFNPISPKPKTIELKIKNVGGVLERSFQWSL